MRKGIQFHVTFLDGEMLSSDKATWEDLVTEIRASNTKATEKQIEWAIEEIVANFGKVGKADHLTISIGGSTYGINPAQVKYVKIERI